MPPPLRPKTRVNRLTTPSGLGSFLLEAPFACQNDAVLVALKQVLGIPSDWFSSSTFRLTPLGPEFYDATHAEWIRMSFDNGQPTFTPLPAAWPDDATFRITASGPEFYDTTHAVWIRMSFDAGQLTFTTL